MNKRLVLVVMAILAIGVAAIIFLNAQNNSSGDPANSSATTTTDKQPSTSTTSNNDTDARYITLATYNTDPNRYSNYKKVYFFHASWCPICQKIDKDLTRSTDSVPSDTLIIKTDFDNTPDLRKKYGVTTQYTFVQVDDAGNEISQWSATSLSDAVSGIKS
jgi:thiol-disulfide isomerase/thioredoxin